MDAELDGSLEHHYDPRTDDQRHGTHCTEKNEGKMRTPTGGGQILTGKHGGGDACPKLGDQSTKEDEVVKAMTRGPHDVQGVEHGASDTETSSNVCRFGLCVRGPPPRSLIIFKGRRPKMSSSGEASSDHGE